MAIMNDSVRPGRDHKSTSALVGLCLRGRKLRVRFMNLSKPPGARMATILSWAIVALHLKNSDHYPLYNTRVHIGYVF